MDAKQLVRVLEHRTGPDGIEGLCEFSDGSREWRQPSSVDVEIRNDRTGELVETSDVKVGATHMLAGAKRVARVS